MKIALLPMSCKPYHVGHDLLIKLAASECDEARLFVSLSDRKRPGEFPVSGEAMGRVWTLIEPSLPNNVEVNYGGSPVGKVWQELGLADQTDSDDEYVIYSDPEDLATNFPERSLSKYCGNLYDRGKVILRAVSRDETADISGTQMRQFLANNDEESFLENFPSSIDGRQAWRLLKHETYDVSERAKAKQRSRDQDAQDLASGKKTREQLRRENGVFGDASKFQINWKKSGPKR